MGIGELVVVLSIITAALLGTGAAGATALVGVRYRTSDGYREREALKEDLSRVRRQIGLLEDVVAHYDNALALAVQRYEQVARRRLLEQFPLEDLKKYGAKNIRWGGVQARGVTNLAQLRQRLSHLEAFDGIGGTSAERIRTAAQSATRDLMAREIPLPGPELSDPEEMRVARAVEERTALRQDTQPLLERLRAVDDDMSQRAQAPGVSFWNYIRDRDAFESAERQTTEARGALTRRLEAVSLGQAPQRPQLTDAEVREGFQENYADAVALVDNYVRGATDRPSSHGNLEADIAKGVEQFPLDTQGLDVRLRKYQAFGASFMLVRQRTVVGDEMGLGKTIEALAAMNHLARRGKKHFLVVSPAGLIFNWKNEILNRSLLEPTLLYGSDREAAIRKWSRNGGVGITSYATLRAMKHELFQQQVPIAMAVVDEAHYVKNPDAQRTQATKEVLQRSELACLMTGTPMENEPEEFTNLIEMVSPRVARSVRGRDGVVDPHKFKKRVADVYLRRNQHDVLTELPETIEHEDWVQLKRADARAYVNAVRERQWHQMRQTAVVGDRHTLSAKLERLGELFETYREQGRKIVVFSFYHAALQAVMRRWPFVMGPLTGKVTPARRQELLDRFKQVGGFGVLASQIQVGGVGVNLQFASVVVLMEPQLKPSTEEQAIARLRRMGQVRSVMVHRLLAEGTLEEDILEVLGRKRRQFDAYARDSLAKAMSAKATEADQVTAIIERQTLRLVAQGFLPPRAAADINVIGDDDTQALTRPIRAIDVDSVEVAREREAEDRPGEPVTQLSSEPVDRVQAMRVSQIAMPAVQGPPSEQSSPQRQVVAAAGAPSREKNAPQWAEELVMVLDAEFRDARVDEDKALVVLSLLHRSGLRTNIAAIAEALDTNPARATRLVSMMGRVLNVDGKVFQVDRADGHVRLDAERACRRVDVDYV